jgi:hypothetical protein
MGSGSGRGRYEGCRSSGWILKGFCGSTGIELVERGEAGEHNVERGELGPKVLSCEMILAGDSGRRESWEFCHSSVIRWCIFLALSSCDTEADLIP